MSKKQTVTEINESLNNNPYFISNLPSQIRRINEYVFSTDTRILEFRNVLRSKKYRVSDTDNSYRTIHSWGESGLLLGDEDRETGWRAMSIVQVCWLNIIRELRKIGMEKEKIKMLKRVLFDEMTDKEAENYEIEIDEKKCKLPDRQKRIENQTLIFEFYLLEAINKQDVYLVVNNQGMGILVTETEYQASQIINPLPITHIMISLNKIYAEILNKPELIKKNKTLFDIDEKYVSAILGIQENAQEVNITGRNGKPNKLQIKKSIQNPEKALQLIKEMTSDGKRKRISLEVQDKNIIAIEEIEKT